MYFENFPFIQYDSLGDGNPKELKNLLRRVKVRSDIRSNSSLFDTYFVREGETPEMIADRLYDNVNLHWVVLLFNDITDRYHQWPMSGGQFLDYVNDKYKNTDGTSNVDGTHHYKVTRLRRCC